jgi:hypothetical protein
MVEPTALSAEAELVRRIAATGFTDGIDVLASLQVITQGNDVFIIRGIVEGGAARAAVLVRKALFQRVLIMVKRAYDNPRRKGGDRHTKVAIDFLSDPQVFDEVAQHGSRTHLEQAVEFWRSYSSDPRLTRLKHYRDKAIAHLAEKDPEIGDPTINDLTYFATGTADLWARLAWGAGVVGLDMRSQIDPYEESAKAFWRPWYRPPGSPPLTV